MTSGLAIASSQARKFHARVLELNGGKWFNFEPHLASLYKAVLRPGSVAVDGGANIGLHTLQMALAVSPGGLVIAVEPVPELRARLEERREEHGIPPQLIQIVPSGLSDKAGTAEFFQVTDGPQHELSGLKYRHFLEKHSVRKIEVPLTTLNSICAYLQRLDYVKLDVEGAELPALHGGFETLQKFRPVVSIEQDQYSPKYFGYSWQDLSDYFNALKYEVYDLFGIRYSDPEMFNLCAVWDFVGLPAEYPAKEYVFDAVRQSMKQSGVRLPAGTEFRPPEPAQPASGKSRMIEPFEQPSWLPHSASHNSKTEQPASNTFLVAPWIEEAGIRSWYDDPELAEMLRHSGLRPAAILEGVLSTLDGGKPANGIDLGYMLSINVYDLFSKNGEWAFDPGKLRFFIDFMRDAGRPVAINLRANHFVGESELARELAADESCLARTNDGSPIREIYFNNTTFAPVFSLDERIPLNRFRFGGFREATAILARFDRECPGILRAVTLAGELHHYVTNLADPNSAGRFAGVQITDYSDASIREFAAWLRGQHASVEAVNERFGTSFTSWLEVAPPRIDITQKPDAPLWMHMDSYCSGSLPIFGWADLGAGDRIEIFLDGECLGEARYHLSRVDVYEAIPHLADSDIGFRYDLAYSQLARGAHEVHLVVRRVDGRRFLLARRTLWVGRAEPGGTVGAYPRLNGLPAASGAGLAGCADHPADGQRLLYNPFAAEWQRFREFQVSSLLAAFTRIAMESGLDPNKIYSHQIASHLEGSWNYSAFAVDARDLAEAPCLPGLNLYGGSVMSPHLLPLTGGRRYGVPELHPRMGKPQSRSIFRRALDYHRSNGAAFVCPYFMGIGRRKLGGPRNPVGDMRIDPLNPVLGSSFFYAALQEFLRQ
jgi:FkbM family methyltransferase